MSPAELDARIMAEWLYEQNRKGQDQLPDDSLLDDLDSRAHAWPGVAATAPEDAEPQPESGDRATGDVVRTRVDARARG